MLREALSNVARHAAATHVDVEVVVSEGRMRVIVADDGRGLDGTMGTGGRGVANLKARAARRGGTFELSGGPDGGTTLRWSVPLGT